MREISDGFLQLTVALLKPMALGTEEPKLFVYISRQLKKMIRISITITINSG